jgi:hypothetical protein
MFLGSERSKNTLLIRVYSFLFPEPISPILRYRQYAPLVLTISTLLYMFWPANGKRVYVRGILRALSAP